MNWQSVAAVFAYGKMFLLLGFAAMLAAVAVTSSAARASSTPQALGPVPLSTSTFELYDGRVYLPVEIKGNGEASPSFQITKNVNFRFGTAELTEKTVAVIPLEEIERREGRTISGVLGVICSDTIQSQSTTETRR